MSGSSSAQEASATDTSMDEKPERPAVIREKTLEGGDVLRMVRVEVAATTNDVRLHLAVGDSNSFTLFASDQASGISPEECATFFEHIKSKQEFLDLSEENRARLLGILSKK